MRNSTVDWMKNARYHPDCGPLLVYCLAKFYDLYSLSIKATEAILCISRQKK